MNTFIVIPVKTGIQLVGRGKYSVIIMRYHS
jgi:hypothetical protein